MQYIDMPAAGISPQRGAMESISTGLIQCDQPEQFLKFEKAFQFRPEKVLEISNEINSTLKADDVMTPEGRADIMLLELLAKCYAPHALPNWKAVFAINVVDVGWYTAAIENGTCEINKGEPGQSDVLLTMTTDSLVAFVRHQIFESAHLVHAGADEDEIFGPVTETDIIELRADQIAQIAGGTAVPCHLDFCATFNGVPGTQTPGFDAGDNPCGSQNSSGAPCASNACGSQSGAGAPCAGNVCAGNACAGDTCGADACGADACAGEACAIDACGIEACVGNACVIDAPAGGAGGGGIGDSCIVNVVPGVPGV